MQTTDRREKDDPISIELDRRLWPRGAGEETDATLWTGVEKSKQATVLNESQTGVAVLVDDGSRLYPDREVRLIYGSELMWAIVRHATPADDGKTQVGLEWGCAPGRLSPLSLPPGDLE